MDAEAERRFCKEIHDNCHEMLKEISALVIDKLLMELRSANFNYKLFKRGFDAFERIERVLYYPEDDPAVTQAFSAAEALIKEFEEEYRSKMGIFKDQDHIDAQMKKMIRRFSMSKYVLINVPADMRRRVRLTWGAACLQAHLAWSVYKPMEHQIEYCYKETKEGLQELETIEERIVQNPSRNYTERDIRQQLSSLWPLNSGEFEQLVLNGSLTAIIH
ncbi:hypothetical protein ACEPAF_7168 [Sanghuangporus sanghuang]